jgi:protein ImuB
MHWIALQPEPAAPGPADDTLVDPHTALAWWALQFTPLVARVEDVLVLEVSGSERLFGGRETLLERLFASNKPVAQVKSAWGATSLIAIGRLGSGRLDSPPDALPVRTLAAAQAHGPTLVRLGCRTWGDLRRLPRGGLVRRFGTELVAALDRAYGQAPEVYPWLTVPEVFDAPLELLASVDTAPALMFGARRLLAQLRVWLQLRQRGVLALELLWELDARRSNAQHIDAHHSGGAQCHVGKLVLRTAQPTQDMQHLQRLMAEQLQRVNLPAPVLHLRLRSLQTQALAGESLSLLPEDQRQGDSLLQLLERLSARLGPQSVLVPRLQADHRPERMQQWNPATQTPPAQPVKPGKPSSQLHTNIAMNSGATQAGSTWAPGINDSKLAPHAALYPSWLLATPQRLVVQQGQPQYHGALELLAGPQRLEAGWLEEAADCALRDYFVARSAQAGLLWVYRERLAGPGGPASAHWYLHGLFA